MKYLFIVFRVGCMLKNSLSLLCFLGLCAVGTTMMAAQPARIAWFGSLDQGLAEAKRTNKPILLISAAPHCHGVPGVW